MNFKSKRGVAALITVLSIGGLIFTISMGSAIIAFWANQNIKSIRDSNKAFYAAYSGLQEALIRLERDKNFSNAGYNLSLYSTNDTSIVVSNSGSSATITLTSSIGASQKKLQTVADIDATTGLITPTSTVEQTL